MFDSMKRGFGWSFGFLFGIIAMNVVAGKYLENIRSKTRKRRKNSKTYGEI